MARIRSIQQLGKLGVSLPGAMRIARAGCGACQAEHRVQPAWCALERCLERCCGLIVTLEFQQNFAQEFVCWQPGAGIWRRPVQLRHAFQLGGAAQ